MVLLQAVNFILRKLGEAPVTGLDVAYPTVSIALPAIDEARRELLAEEWYFNTFKIMPLVPELDGVLQVPKGILQAYPVDPLYVYSGKYIVHRDTGEPITVPVDCRVIQDVPFEDLPWQAQHVIQLKAAYAVYVQDFGEDETSQVILQETHGAYTQLSAQHTRMRQYNTRQKRAWQRYKRNLYL